MWDTFLAGALTGAGLVILYVLYRTITTPVRIEHQGKQIVKTDALTRQAIEIPIQDPDGTAGTLVGEIYRSRYTPNPAPYVILCHGFGGFHNDMHFEQMSASFAMAGFAVLAYDQRCHGETQLGSFKKHGIGEFLNIFHDIMHVINFVERLPDLAVGRIGIVGFSLGGLVALCYPLNDPRVKIIIAGCAPHDAVLLFEQHAQARIFTLSWAFYLLMKRKVKFQEADLQVIQDKLSLQQYARPEVDYSHKVFLAHAFNRTTITLVKAFNVGARWVFRM